MEVLSKSNIQINDRVLDLGCGDGRITMALAKITSDGCVLGTDISVKMTDFASKAYQAQNNLRFLEMDASKNIFREQFDVITSAIFLLSGKISNQLYMPVMH